MRGLFIRMKFLDLVSNNFNSIIPIIISIDVCTMSHNHITQLEHELSRIAKTETILNPIIAVLCPEAHEQEL